MALLKMSAKNVAKVPYTFEDDIKIIEMSEKEVSASKIAKVMGRSEHTIRYRQRWLRNCKFEKVEELKKYHSAKTKK